MSAAFVTTIKERCRMCYTCVRECPAKAIRIAEGQAEVMPERCIACGNCIQVCSQLAKQVRGTIDEVESLLASGHQVAACLAPSFPAEFTQTDYSVIVGMLRALGFAIVAEVSFGADLIARRYRDLLAQTEGRRFIATTCPAVTGYVERYHPELVGSLAPIVSPMVATARALRRLHGDDLKVVFIGPCIAKKVEAASNELKGDIDAVLTFLELRRMFESHDIDPDNTTPSEFDPPHGAAGALYAISRGFLQAAGLQEDLMVGEIVATHGRLHMQEGIKEFADGDLGARLLETLCCEGCVMGAGISNSLPIFNRRRHVRKYAAARMEKLNDKKWLDDMVQFADLDLSRRYHANDQRIPLPETRELTATLERMGKFKAEDELNCGACGYATCREHASAICEGLAESEMCLPFTIDQLQTAVKELENSREQLADTQEALLQSEKMASMGQLAAGIAHEVNNPLGVVLMYAHLLLEECEANSKFRDDLMMITEQADRCKKIVAGLLHFARQNKLVKHPADIRQLVDRAMRTIPLSENVALRFEHDLDDPIAEVDRDQVVQVLTNLVTNAAAAMENGGTLTVRTGGDESRVRISVADTGTGIKPENINKVFEPFFTTKQMGKGTGLGLAVTYGIVKMHNGDIRVQSNSDPDKGPTGTTFTVTLPRHEK
jgi:signal transduction histidine kinase/Pyruvate/2-oxoacid:ferredoxin oxidoreductase delta subunit